jgi:lysophospholipase L1-like esterase
MQRVAIASAVIAAGALAVAPGRARAEPAPSPPAPRQVLAVGDSLTFGALAHQTSAFIAAGWRESHVSAHGSRGIVTKVPHDRYTGLTAVDALRAQFGDTTEWIVALGTNDSRLMPPTAYTSLIRRMLDRIGPGRRVVWVNLYLPGDPERMAEWNGALAVVAHERPDALRVYDWARVAARHPDWMAPDRIHHTADGYRGRARAVAIGARALFDAPLPRARDRQGWSYST